MNAKGDNYRTSKNLGLSYKLNVSPLLSRNGGDAFSCAGRSLLPAVASIGQEGAKRVVVVTLQQTDVTMVEQNQAANLEWR